MKPGDSKKYFPFGFKLGLVLIVLQILCMLYIFKNDAHYTRLILFNVAELDRERFKLLYSAPETLVTNYGFSFEDVTRLSKLRQEIEPICLASTNEIDKLYKIKTFVRNISFNCKELVKGYASPEDLLKKMRTNSLRGNCAHYSFLYVGYLGSVGIDARLVGLDAEDRLGGNGHCCVEAYCKDLRKWVFVDPLNDAMLFDNGMPLSLLELRQRLLNGNRNIQVEQVLSVELKGKEILDYYSTELSDIGIHSHNDLSQRFKSYYGPLAEVLAPFDRYIPYQFKGAIA